MFSFYIIPLSTFQILTKAGTCLSKRKSYLELKKPSRQALGAAAVEDKNLLSGRCRPAREEHIPSNKRSERKRADMRIDSGGTPHRS